MGQKVIDIGLEEALELQSCQRVLKETLTHLDRLGAGIAAVHVNAAVESLTSNLDRNSNKAIDSRDVEFLSKFDPSSLLH